MRIDRFLATSTIVKRRTVSTDMLKEKVVEVNSKIVKPSYEVKVGDVITINYLDSKEVYEVLKIPTMKSIKRGTRDEYIKKN